MSFSFLVGGFIGLFFGKSRGQKVVFPKSDFHGAGDSKYYSNDAMKRLSKDHTEVMNHLSQKEQKELFHMLQTSGSKDGVTIDELGSALSDLYKNRPKSSIGEIDKRESREIADTLLPPWAKKKYFRSKDL